MNITHTIAVVAVLSAFAVAGTAEARQPFGTIAPTTLLRSGNTFQTLAPSGARGPVVTLPARNAPLQMVKFTPPCKRVGTPYLQTRCL